MSHVKNFFTKYWVLLIFFFFACGMAFLGVWYFRSLYPGTETVSEIIKKFSADGYTLPYHVAERYLVYSSMRTYFFMLDYLLTLLSILATLMTVFYASTNVKQSKEQQLGTGSNSGVNRTGNSPIVFLSLLSVFFTIANMFINPGSKAYMSQYAWRELDVCITKTIHQTDLTVEEKNMIFAEKISEAEYYIESFEH